MSERASPTSEPKAVTSRRSFLKVLGAASATTAVAACSSEHRRGAHSVSRPSRRDGCRCLELLRVHVPRVRRGMRPAARGARWPHVQGRGKSRSSAEPWRALLARPGVGAGTLQSRSLPSAHAPQGWQAHADLVDAGDHAAHAAARECAERGHGRRRGVHQSARDRELPRISRHVARGLRHAAAPELRRARRRRRDRGEQAELRRRVAVARFHRGEDRRVVRRRLPRDVGRERAAAALLRRRTREGSGCAARDLRRAAPLAHRLERRPVDRVQAGLRAGDRERARRHRLDRPGGAERPTFPRPRCRRSPPRSRARRAFCSPAGAWSSRSR